MNNEHCGHHHAHFSWAAVFVGALVGVGLGFLFHLFRMAFGLNVYGPMVNGANVIAIGGLIGLAIGVIVSMGVAGFVAGSMGRFHHHCGNSMVYGFVTWILALMLSALLLMPISHYVAFAEDTLNPSVMMTEMATSNDGASKSTSIPVEKNKKMKATTQTAPTNMAWTGWIVFSLFLVGALSSCIGAGCGMGCRKDME